LDFYGNNIKGKFQNQTSCYELPEFRLHFACLINGRAGFLRFGIAEFKAFPVQHQIKE
jgi:hypothetical protein